MLNIKIKEENKSIKAPLEFQIPDFTVLTGVNGSGKTHLFEAISDPKKGEVYQNDKRITNIRFVKFNELNSSIRSKCGTNEITRRVDQIWNQVKAAIQQIERRNKRSLEGIEEPEKDPVYVYMKNKNSISEVVLDISKRSGILPSQLTENIINANISSLDLVEANDVFSKQVSLIFKAYQNHYVDNVARKDQGILDKNKNKTWLDDQEFVRKYGPKPWDTVNDLLTRLKLPYVTTNPTLDDYNVSFELKLTHSTENFSINPSELSTGEKTLISFALAMYNFNEQGSRAEMLIIDEPDAPLHPSMSKILLEILSKEIVGEYYIPVLISTHSVATIACVPGINLYKLDKCSKIPLKCDLSDAVDLLSSSIPNFSLSIDSRRQVFVEHQYDVQYFETIFGILKRYKPSEFSTYPQFLSPTRKNGSNCSDVLSITQRLKDSGNTTVYGLIDWDGKNKPDDHIVILGLENRYAIENYIFDPHILGLFLIRENYCSAEDMGFESCKSYVEVYDALKIDWSLLHIIVSKVEEKIFHETTKNHETFNSELNNGKTLKIRNEWKNSKGHDLEELCKNTWPQLNSIQPHNNDSTVKINILETVINDFPEFLSKDILNTFKEFK